MAVTINYYKTPKIKHLCKDETGVSFYSPVYDQIPMRMIIVGASGTGKSTLIREFLLAEVNDTEDLEDNPLALEHTYYEYYTDAIEKSSTVRNIEEKPYTELTGPLTLQRAKEYEKKYRCEHGIIVFDDPPAGDKRLARIIESYYDKARHINQSLVYVTHSAAVIPELVRSNSNILIAMKGADHIAILANISKIQKMNWETALKTEDLRYVIASGGELNVFVGSDNPNGKKWELETDDEED